MEGIVRPTVGCRAAVWSCDTDSGQKGAGRQAWRRALGALAAVLIAVSIPAVVNGSSTSAIPRDGPCPKGYAASGAYCVAGKAAGPAVPRINGCPRDYVASGKYCVGKPGASDAIVRRNGCPRGYSASGSYCISRVPSDAGHR